VTLSLADGVYSCDPQLLPAALFEQTPLPACDRLAANALILLLTLKIERLPQLLWLTFERSKNAPRVLHISPGRLRESHQKRNEIR